MKVTKQHTKWTTERISQTVLYVLIALTVAVFAAFYFIGFDMQMPDEGGYNAPLLTGMLIAFMWILLLLTIVVFAVSVMKELRMRRSESRLVNGIPATRISCVTAGVTTVLLAATYLFAPTDSISINGKPYSDVFWLKLSDMFVLSSIALIVMAIFAVLFGSTRYRRRRMH